MRFYFTPNAHSPTYDVESDGNRHFVELHAVWDTHPNFRYAKKLNVEPYYLEFIMGDGWQEVLLKRDGLGLKT